jgi:hypothetical protein
VGRRATKQRGKPSILIQFPDRHPESWNFSEEAQEFPLFSIGLRHVQNEFHCDPDVIHKGKVFITYSLLAGIL